jgi:hypothetical protein
LPWLNKCEQFFRIQSTEEAGKVFLAAFYMTGDAAQWYALVERNHGTTDWAAWLISDLGHPSAATCWAN